METPTDHFAAARARQALKAAGLPFEVQLERASSTRNEVFMSDDVVIRVNRHPNQRLRRELCLYRHLPDRAWTPRAIHAGGEFGSDYLVVERKPGELLSRAWPIMGAKSRKRAIRCLAAVLDEIHSTPTPLGIPDLDLHTHLLDGRAISPVAPTLMALRELARQPHLDAGLLRDVEALVLRGADAMLDFHRQTLIHGDLTFENILWDGHEITGLLDLEWCRGSSRDLDLDVLLRFCALPFAHVAPDYEQHVKARDYEDVPLWLAEASPALFAHPDLHDRLLAYCASFDVQDLMNNIPTATTQLGPLHPLNRLRGLAATGAHVTPFMRRLGIPV